MRTHYEKNGRYLCNSTVKKKPDFITKDKSKVDCLNCLDALNDTSLARNATKIPKEKINEWRKKLGWNDKNN